MSTLVCTYCDRPLDPEALFERLCGYIASLRLFRADCPPCGKSLEFQVRSGRLELGYTYASGAPHFEGMLTVPLSGIRMPRDRPGTIEFRDRTYRAPDADAQRSR